nr:MAG TPA: hypothetical protein [Caudoviricetes sp.]
MSVRHSNISNPTNIRWNTLIVIEYNTKSIYFISLISSEISINIWICIIHLSRILWNTTIY